MYKYFTQNETRIWVEKIDNFVKGYNNTSHTVIKMTPLEASKPGNEEIVWWNIYFAYVTAEFGVPRFKIDETVRISKYKSVFNRGYLPSFTEEYFKIKKVLIENPTVQKLVDLKGEDLSGIFYENELRAFNPSDETSYKIEKIIDKETIKGIKYVLVK